MTAYTSDEIRQIRWIITEFSQMFRHAPFSRELRDSNSISNGLRSKIAVDTMVSKYSIFAFFPEIHQMISDGQNFEIDVIYGYRGAVAFLRNPEKSFVIKQPQEDKLEIEIARRAGELGVGPRQHESIDGYLSEELIAGQGFFSLEGEQLCPSNMYSLGVRLGEIMKALHSNGIIYNEMIFCSCRIGGGLGGPHFLVRNEKPAVLLDYGISKMNPKKGDAIDKSYVKEAIRMGAERFGEERMEPFSEGVREAYPELLA